MVDIFGADHIATVPDVLAGLRALGYDADKVTVSAASIRNPIPGTVVR